MSVDRLEVATPQGFAGVLERATGGYRFGYDPRAQPAVAISLAMPVRMPPYERATLPPIFQMNLPEGYLLERLRNLLAKASGFDPMLLLSLLGGAEAIGRMRVAAAGDAASAPATNTGERLADILAYRGAQGLFDSLADRYLMRSGLSGVQPKVLVPERPEPKASALTSDLIVKSGLGEFAGLAINEFICMSVARRAGIPVPEFHLSDDRSLFVMRRFDRDAAGQALGFEDMAVLAGRDAARKYEGRYEDIAKLVGAYCSPAHVRESLAQLFDMVALSCVLGNGDAHLKNFGLLYADVDSGPVRLAPAFDIVNTTCYLPQDALALSLGGNKSLFASRLTLLEFAQSCRLPAAQARRRILELADVAAAVLSEQRDLAEAVPGFTAVLDRGIERFRQTFNTP